MGRPGSALESLGAVTRPAGFQWVPGEVVAIHGQLAENLHPREELLWKDCLLIRYGWKVDEMDLLRMSGMRPSQEPADYLLEPIFLGPMLETDFLGTAEAFCQKNR